MKWGEVDINNMSEEDKARFHAAADRVGARVDARMAERARRRAADQRAMRRRMRLRRWARRIPLLGRWGRLWV